MDMRNSEDRIRSGTRDLGRFNTPVLVCGGAYSNLEALQALIATARQLAIPPARIIHTGDAIAYCADPCETAKLLQDAGVHAIQGNVEESLAASLPNCGCGFNEDSLCDQLAHEWFSYADARTGIELRRWMGALPLHLTFEMSGLRVRTVHGSVQEINRFMFASHPMSDFDAEFTHAAADVIVAGHSGIPFTRHVGNRVWHNPGSLGIPANDGTPRAWYSVLTPQEDGIRIDHHSLDYDHERAKAKMVDAGVCTEYAQALSNGLWPSLDILPEAEKIATGVPLDLSKSFFCANRTAVAE